MLHYFAKRFFAARILSAYREAGNVRVYYVNDDVYRQKRSNREQTNRWNRQKSWFEKRSSRRGPHWLYSSNSLSREASRETFSSLLGHRDSHFTSLPRQDVKQTEYSREQQQQQQQQHWSNEDDVAAADNYDDDDDDDDDMRDNCTMIVQCYHWNSFEPRANWTSTFTPVSFSNQLLNYSSTGCSKKTVPLFYFCDNFCKCAPILTIFSLVEQEIYDA